MTHLPQPPQLLRLQVWATVTGIVVFFSSINSLIFLSELSILVSISSNLFSTFLVSLHWVRTCSFSSQKFLITHFSSLILSFHHNHSLSSLVPLLVKSCDPLQEGRCSGFGYFHPFCTSFFPSLWIYPPVVCVVADFQIVSLSGCPDCW